MLNGLWRITDDGQRWRLEQRLGRLGRGDVWVTKGYFIGRDQLLGAIAGSCGSVDSAALGIIEARWPEVHPRPIGD